MTGGFIYYCYRCAKWWPGKVLCEHHCRHCELVECRCKELEAAKRKKPKTDSKPA